MWLLFLQDIYFLRLGMLLYIYACSYSKNMCISFLCVCICYLLDWKVCTVPVETTDPEWHVCVLLTIANSFSSNKLTMWVRWCGYGVKAKNSRTLIGFVLKKCVICFIQTFHNGRMQSSRTVNTHTHINSARLFQMARCAFSRLIRRLKHTLRDKLIKGLCFYMYMLYR